MTAIVVVLLGMIYLVVWKSPKYYEPAMKADLRDSITAFRDYSKFANHRRPFIIEGENFVIFGAPHTRDPKHPDLKSINSKWHSLKPTVALVEGRLGFLFPYFMDPVKNLGEGGRVKQLASRDGIPVYNWDFPKETLATALLDSFPAEQVALSQILQPYFSNLRFGRPASPENFVQTYLGRAGYVGQKANFQNVSDVDKAWKKYFPQGPDWRDVSDEKELPGYLSGMMSVCNDLRNRRLVAVVRELTAKKERVFLICGSSHAFCVSPAFQ